MFVEIASGGFHTCGRTIGGSAYCWGKAGGLGDGIHVGSAVPVPVFGGLQFKALTAGEAHICAIAFDARALLLGLE